MASNVKTTSTSAVNFWFLTDNRLQSVSTTVAAAAGNDEDVDDAISFLPASTTTTPDESRQNNAVASARRCLTKAVKRAQYKTSVRPCNNWHVVLAVAHYQQAFICFYTCFFVTVRRSVYSRKVGTPPSHLAVPKCYHVHLTTVSCQLICCPLCGENVRVLNHGAH